MGAVTTTAIVIAAIAVVAIVAYRYQKRKRVPKTWIQVYNTGGCPYGIANVDKIDPVAPEEQQLVRAIINKRALPAPRPRRPIPRIIIQTNEEDLIPRGMREATQSIIDKNPGYDYRYFNNVRARDFIIDHFDEPVVVAYDTLIPGAYRADLFRYCILYVIGGCYVDMGMIAITPFDEIISRADRFLVAEDNNTGGLYNAFMCVEPGSPIVAEAIRQSVENIERRNYTDSPLAITGPLLLARAFETVVGREVLYSTDYGAGIRTLRHFKPDECMSGEIHAPRPGLGDGETTTDIRVISTRSPTYRRDQQWYNKRPRYTDLWNQRHVFSPESTH